MANAEKRSVSTDALETLGTTIGEGAGRDAIHLAVEPVVAGMSLVAGEHVGLVDGKAFSSPHVKTLGIVDPFLTESVREGQKFWLVLYPRQITSLRHVWEHPDFPESKGEVKQEEGIPADSVRWIRDYASSLGLSYEDLMYAADDYQAHGGYLNRGDLLEGAYTSETFWLHYGLIRGRTVENNGNFFRCAC